MHWSSENTAHGFADHSVNDDVYAMRMCYIALLLLSEVLVAQCFILRTGVLLKLRPHYANPVNADGSNYRSGITEEQAFEWFDEAEIFAKGGSGGAGSNTFRYGKARQHLGMSTCN